MKYTIKYTGTRTEKYTKALLDARFYNEKGVNILMKEFPRMWLGAKTLADRRKAVHTMKIYASFAGIQGFPLRAIRRAALNSAGIVPPFPLTTVKKWQGVYPGMCINPDVCKGYSHCPRHISCCE